jgi:CRISPR-associated protein Csa1
MYFLAEEEKRLLLRKLLPQARDKGVVPELRGWNWDKPPLSPVYGVRLAMYEIAGKYCPTARDLYLRRVLGVKKPATVRMLEGSLLHQFLCDLIVQAKRTIYNHGTRCLDELKRLTAPALDRPDVVGDAEQQSALEQKVSALWEYEHSRIVTRVQEILARQPHVGVDALVALALPVTVEQRLDGGFLGLSAHLSADAFVFSEPMLVDLKFGARQDFHRLGTAGYALVMESLYEYPVNVGCVVYASFKDGGLQIQRDFHVIDDELRQWFIEERDEKMRMVEEEIDPGVAYDCPEYCSYWTECHPA